MTLYPDPVAIQVTDDYCRLYGIPSVNPLVTVFDLRNATRPVNHITVDYGLYAIFLKQGAACTVSYGRREYDCRQGTVVTFAPGQRVRFDAPTTVIGPDVTGLLVHPDLLASTPLGERIGRYAFFGYSQLESLHLSADERETFNSLLAMIDSESRRKPDSHSATILAGLVTTLLDYLLRFYDRQFQLRRHADSGVVAAFEQALEQHFAPGSHREGLPSVAHFASMANLTPGYFGDLISRATGHTAQELIAIHTVNRARRLLATTALPVSAIAYDLGFQYPQHFARLFKRHTSMSPTDYRRRFHTTPV